MSGNSLDDAIYFSDDEAAFSEDELDVQNYSQFGSLCYAIIPLLISASGSEDSDDEHEIIPIDDDDDDIYMVDHPGPASVPSPKTFEVPSLNLTCGKIRSGSVVELKDHTGRDPTHLISGDFLWIRKIIEDVETEVVSLKGHRMRRVEYLQPLFDSMWNP